MPPAMYSIRKILFMLIGIMLGIVIRKWAQSGGLDKRTTIPLLVIVIIVIVIMIWLQ